MHPPISPEKRRALRELREREPPTFPRLAAASETHVTTLREIASVENWEKQNFQGDVVMIPVRRAALLAADAALEAQGSQSGAEVGGDGGEAAGVLAELVPGNVGAVVVEEMMAILTEARRTGRISKERADALWSMIRVAEHAQKLQPEAGQKEQKRSDDELAEILARVDERIVELARGYAERLVARQPDGAAG
jgi:hypothetical protein